MIHTVLNRTSEDVEKRILLLKCVKAKKKTAFTKLKNKLLGILDYEGENPSRTLVKDIRDCLLNAQEIALLVMERLYSEYGIQKDDASMRKISEEIETLEEESD